MKQNTINERKIYQELIRVSNLYYSNCTIWDMLNYISNISGLITVLADSAYQPVSARFPTASDKQEPDPSQSLNIIPLSKFPDADSILPIKLYDRVLNFKVLNLPNQTHFLCIEKDFESKDSFIQTIIKNALPFLALTVDKESVSAFSNYSSDYYDLFLQILHGGAGNSPEKIRNICNIYNFNPDLKRICMTIQLEDTSTSAGKLKELTNQIRMNLTNEKYFLISQKDYISIFLLYSTENQDLDIITQSYVLAESLFEELSGDYSLRIGFSSAHTGIETIGASFEESFKSINIQKQLKLPESASSYFEQSIYHILNIPELQNFRKLANDIISPLIEYDTVNGANYFETLQQYYFNSFNMQKTANALYIHRNTLTYRLQQIKELLKFDFDFEHNIDALLTLYLCVCVYKLGYHPGK